MGLWWWPESGTTKYSQLAVWRPKPLNFVCLEIWKLRQQLEEKGKAWYEYEKKEWEREEGDK